MAGDSRGGERRRDVTCRFLARGVSRFAWKPIATRSQRYVKTVWRRLVNMRVVQSVAFSGPTKLINNAHLTNFPSRLDAPRPTARFDRRGSRNRTDHSTFSPFLSGPVPSLRRNILLPRTSLFLSKFSEDNYSTSSICSPLTQVF